MAHPQIDVNNIEQDNAPRMAVFVASRLQYLKTGTPLPEVPLRDESYPFIVYARSTRKQIGKVRDLETGEVIEGADQFEYLFERYYLPADRPLRLLHRLATTLDPRTEMFIAGDIVSHDWAVIGPRRLKQAGKIKPTICDTPKTISVLDIDKMPTPEGFDFNDRDQLFTLVKQHLPAFTREAEMMIAATSSHGFKGATASCRVFLHLSRPMTLREQKALFSEYVGSRKDAKVKNPNPLARIDGALFVPTQPVFVGAAFMRKGKPAADPYEHVRFFLRNPDGGPVEITDDILTAMHDAVPTVIMTPTGPQIKIERRLRDVDADDYISWSDDFDGELLGIATTDDWLPSAPGAHYQTIKAARAAYREDPYADVRVVEKRIGEALAARFERAARSGHPRDAASVLERLADVARQVQDAEHDYGIPGRVHGAEPPPAPSMSADAAQAAFATAIEPVFEAALRSAKWHIANRDLRQLDDYVDAPPSIMARVSVGVGKTHVVLARIKQLIDDGRAALRLPRIGYVVPSHKLAKEIEAKLRAASINVCRYIGIQAEGEVRDDDPNCDHPALVGKHRQAYGDTRVFCQVCPKFASCEIAQQDTSKAQVVILAGQPHLKSLASAARRPGYSAKPHAPLIDGDDDEAVESFIAIEDGLFDRHFDLLVIDETSPTSWVHDEEMPPAVLLADVSNPDPIALKEGSKVDHVGLKEAGAALMAATAPVRQMLETALAAIADGDPVDDDLLRKVPLSTWGEIRTACFDLILRSDDITARGLLSNDPETTKRLAAMREIDGTIRAWLNLGAAMFPAFPDGAIGKVVFDKATVRAKWRGSIHPDFRDIPKLILDATADEILLCKFFPEARFIRFDAVDGPEVVRRAFSDGASDRNLSHPTTRARIIRHVQRQAGRHKALITTKQVLAALNIEMPEVMSTLTTGQYAALRGLNALERCDYLALVGRPFPPYDAIRDLAVQLFGRQIEELEGFYRDPTWEPGYVWTRDPLTRRLTKTLVKLLWHPVAAVRQVIASIRDAEIIQADGRIRAVRRSDAVTVDHVTSGVTQGLVFDAVDQSIPHAKSITEMVMDLAATGFIASHRSVWAAAIGVTPDQMRDWCRKPEITVGGQTGGDFLRSIWDVAVATEAPLMLGRAGRLDLAGTDLSASVPIVETAMISASECGLLKVAF